MARSRYLQSILSEDPERVRHVPVQRVDGPRASSPPSEDQPLESPTPESPTPESPTPESPTPESPTPEFLSLAQATYVDQEIERAKERISRAARKETQQHKRALVLDFLEVLDDLDRALGAAAAGGSDTALVRGVEMVGKKFRDKLARLGVIHEPALGRRFDPARHEAVTVVPVSDPERDGEIVSVLCEGYSLGGEVLRPAIVAVARRRG